MLFFCIIFEAVDLALAFFLRDFEFLSFHHSFSTFHINLLLISLFLESEIYNNYNGYTVLFTGICYNAVNKVNYLLLEQQLFGRHKQGVS